MSDNVKVKHPSYEYFSPIWEKCRDAVEGEKALKDKGTRYLPKPVGMEDSDYDSYLQRTVYYNASGRTVSAISGQIFRKPPLIETSNNDFIDTITVDNKSLLAYANQTLGEWSEVGRVGTLVDVDDSSQPYVAMYKTESITNWKTDIVDNKIQLSLVVLEEIILKPNQTYSHETDTQWRVLKIEDGKYTQEIWRQKKTDSVNIELELVETIVPLMNGQPLGFLPFYILNTTSIGPDVEYSIINDLVDINIGHYINSADYENDLHWSGVKTAVVPGWNPEDPVPLGKALSVGTDSKPFIMESSGSSILGDELTKKEERMATMGSQILANKGRYIAAAETARINDKGETGILSSISSLLDEYFKEILILCYEWGNWGEVETVSFNKDFEPGDLNIDNVMKIYGMISAGQLPPFIGFELLKKYELIDKAMTIEEFEAQIEEKEESEDVLSGMRTENNRTI